MLVEARVVGRGGPVIEPRSVDVTPPGPVSLRQLITDLVRDEVRSYNLRERRQRLIRVLTPEDIDRGAVTGKIDPGGRQTTGQAQADEAVATALQAFEDGLYFVFVDDEQVEDLDAFIVVQADTRVRFVRLVALAGGC